MHPYPGAQARGKAKVLPVERDSRGEEEAKGTEGGEGAPAGAGNGAPCKGFSQALGSGTRRQGVTSEPEPRDGKAGPWSALGAAHDNIG